jgi:hypothetical protein
MKQELIYFLFWLQYEEQRELLEAWLEAKASNSFVAQKYIEWLEESSTQ